MRKSHDGFAAMQISAWRSFVNDVLAQSPKYSFKAYQFPEISVTLPRT